MKVGGGNVVHGDAFMYLVAAGADFIKVGIGGGAICITREQKGIGRGQATAVIEVAQRRDLYLQETGVYVPICSDGGIFQDYHIGLALAMGADFVMMGRYFARFDESPSKIRKIGYEYSERILGRRNKARRQLAALPRGWRSRNCCSRRVLMPTSPYAGKMNDSLTTTLRKNPIPHVQLRSDIPTGIPSKSEIRVSLFSKYPWGGVHDIIPRTTQDG